MADENVQEDLSHYDGSWSAVEEDEPRLTRNHLIPSEVTTYSAQEIDDIDMEMSRREDQEEKSRRTLLSAKRVLRKADEDSINAPTIAMQPFSTSVSQHPPRLRNVLLDARQILDQMFPLSCEHRASKVSQVNEIFDSLERLSRAPLKSGRQLSYKLEHIVERHAVNMVNDLMNEIMEDTALPTQSTESGTVEQDPSGGKGDGRHHGLGLAGGNSQLDNFGATSRPDPSDSSSSKHCGATDLGSVHELKLLHKNTVLRDYSDDIQSECVSSSVDESRSYNEYDTSGDEDLVDDDEGVGEWGNQSGGKGYKAVESSFMNLQPELKKDFHCVSEGDFNSIYELARRYHFGHGVKKDVSEAVNLYQQVADKGHVEALFSLACCYFSATGVVENKEKAIELHKVASDHGHLGSTYRLGLCYEHGIGVDKDETNAFYLYQEAASKGHTLATVKLGFCFWKGCGVDKSVEQARTMFKQGFGNGVLQALFAYALTLAKNPSMIGNEEVNKLIEMQESDCSLFLFQSHVLHTNPLHNEEQTTAVNKAFLDRVNTPIALYCLAELLALTLDPDSLRCAQEIIDQTASQAGNSGYILSKWVSLFMKDQCKQYQLWSDAKVARDYLFVAPKNIRPVALIGEGKLGKVYLSWLQSKRCYVAIKYFPIDLVDKDELLAQEVLSEQLTCRVLASKNANKITKYLGYTDLVDQGKRGLVFELCADISGVQDLLTSIKEDICSSTDKATVDLVNLPDWKEKVPTSLRSTVVFAEKCKWGTVDVVRMLRETAEALMEVHKLGFIHRDIAPRNILCDANGNIQLADFGLAKYAGSNEHGDDDAIFNEYKKAYFTPGHQYALAWWAPECFGCAEKGEPGVFSCNSDVYAFGITMWQCFAHADPFSFVLKRESCNSVATRIQTLIIKGERPSVKKPAGLDRETPDALIELMVSCWNKDPEERPKLVAVIKSIQEVEDDLKAASRFVKTITSYEGGPQKHWHDVTSIYQCLKPPKPIEMTAGLMSGGTHLEMKYMSELQAFSHKQAPSTCIPLSVKANLMSSPYDVFLMHAGEEKSMADCMRNLFEAGNLRCFLDLDMKHGSPTTGTMRTALQTCRYTVVILSKSFVLKKHPCHELKYAFKRLMWIRQNSQAWNSLRVILYDLSIDEYENLCSQSHYVLPSLSKHVTMKEWLGPQIKPWWQECLELKVNLIEEDKNEKGVEKWYEFLNQISHANPDGLPSALYS